jgi:hypothetical protein
MKIQFTLALVFFTSIFSIAQIIVKTNNSSLNLRSEPTKSSNVLYYLPNETELLYANDWSAGWIKVRHSNSYIMALSDNDEVYDYSGWVNAAFVETKMFKSTILDTMSWQDETDGCFYGIYGVDGLLGIDSYDEQSTKFKVKIKGVSYTLTMSEYDGNYFRFEHPKLKIEFFGAETDREIGFGESKGVLRVEFNGKVEYIYAALGGWC